MFIIVQAMSSNPEYYIVVIKLKDNYLLLFIEYIINT